MYLFIIIGVVILIFLFPYLVKQTAKANECTKKMETAGPVISRLYNVTLKKMKECGVSEQCEDFSTAGYEYFEYKTKYNYIDNLHLVVDKNSKQIIYYQLIPFHFDLTKSYNDLQFFNVYSFSDLVKVEINTNLGNIMTSTNHTMLGTGIGNIGVGFGSSNGESTQLVNTMTVDLYFKNGETATCNFLNNRKTIMGSDYYNQALCEAKRLLNICEIIIKENEPKNEVKEQNNNLSQLVELKKILDLGIITQEEFDKKKAEILSK